MVVRLTYNNNINFYGAAQTVPVIVIRNVQRPITLSELLRFIKRERLERELFNEKLDPNFV